MNLTPEIRNPKIPVEEELKKKEEEKQRDHLRRQKQGERKLWRGSPFTLFQ